MHKALLLLFFNILIGVEALEECKNLNERLNITVLYEAMCADSKSFFENFKPVFEEFQDCLDLKLVPYGKASWNGYNTECQHGTVECAGNLLHDCVLHNTESKLQQLDFINCQMRDMRNVANLECAKAVGVNIYTLIKCTLPDSDGPKYQAESANITGRYSFSDIPAIIYDDAFLQSWQYGSRLNLRKTVCLTLVNRLKLENLSCVPAAGQ